MTLLIVGLVLGLVVLVISTDQFVTGASIIARDMAVSTVLVGAVILGCGTGLPELALAFYGSHESPWRQLLQLRGEGGEGLGFAAFFFVLVVILVLPSLFPDRIRRHSPMILIATIAFATLLRGSLDRYEGVAMIFGFFIGVAFILRSDGGLEHDPFGNPADDDYGSRAYIEAPVMTPVQTGIARSLFGLLGTAVGAQLLAFSALGILEHSSNNSDVLRNVIFVCLGSLLPHVVVALQALRQHHEGLAIGNLIGSSLFNSLVIGGLVSVIRPYQSGGTINVLSLGIAAATALTAWLLLSKDTEISRKQGVALLGAYVVLIACAVL